MQYLGDMVGFQIQQVRVHKEVHLPLCSQNSFRHCIPLTSILGEEDSVQLFVTGVTAQDSRGLVYGSVVDCDYIMDQR